MSKLGLSVAARLYSALSSRDSAMLAELLPPDAVWVIDGAALNGRQAIVEWYESIARSCERIDVVQRSLFADQIEPDWLVTEWAWRVGAGDRAHEVEQGVLFHATPDHQISSLRIHTDVRRGAAVSFADPLRPSHRPDIPPRQSIMSHAEILALQDRHVMRGWREGNADMVCSAHAAGTVLISPYEVLHGHEQIRVAVQRYFENYADTQIQVHRVVYDGDQIAVNQTWTCTNRLTGVTAGDEDLIIGVMQDGQIHYWREYFDPNQSAQTLQQTEYGEGKDLGGKD